MQDERKSEKQVLRNLEKENQACRQDLEDALENNFELKSLNTALRDDIQSAKNQYEKLKHTYRRSSTNQQVKNESPTQNTHESYEDRFKALESDFKILENELNQKMDHIDAQNLAYDGLQRELDELKITNRILQGRLSEAGQLITE